MNQSNGSIEASCVALKKDLRATGVRLLRRDYARVTMQAEAPLRRPGMHFKYLDGRI